jgi:hypothetical protein
VPLRELRASDAQSLFALVPLGYLKDADLKDRWGNYYRSNLQGNTTYDWFSISSAGPDGTWGTGDDLTDIGEQFQKIAWILLGFALLFLGMGFVADQTQAWANVLITAFNLTCVGLGGLFLLAIQSITGARWSDPITPAAIDSPAEPMACTMLFSSMVDLPNRLKTAMASTAMGIEADTVSPARKAR